MPFLADAISYAVSILALFIIRAPFQSQRKAVRSHLLKEVRVGVQWIWGQLFMRSMTLLMAGGAFFFSGNTLVIIVLAQQRHASSFLIGCIFACGGIGSIIGASLAPFFKKRLP